MAANETTVKIPSNQLPRTGAQKRRRQVLAWFVQSGDERGNALQETAPSLEISDCERIAEQVESLIDTFTGNDRAEFMAWIVAQTRRLASVTVIVKGLLPSVFKDLQSNPGAAPSCDYGHVTERVLKRLSEFSGHASDTAALQEWAVAMVMREATNLALWLEWITQYDGAIRKGLWSKLRNCTDLGLGDSDEHGRNETVEELVSDVQFWVLDHVEVFRVTGAPLHVRFWELGEKFAKSWMMGRLRQRSKANNLRRLVAEMEDALCQNPRPKPHRIVLGPRDEGALDEAELSEEKEELIAA